MWDELVNDLKSDYTCIQIDLPGFGSSRELGFTTIDTIASELNLLLQDQGAIPTTLFGHSMGGYIALEMVKEKPELFNGLAMIHSTALADSDDKKANRQRVINHLTTFGNEVYLKEFIKDLVFHENFPDLEQQLRALVQFNKTESMVAALNAMMARNDNTAILEKANIPVFWAIGKKDSFIDYRSLFKQASLCEVSYIGYYKKVGHLSVLEDKKKCLTDIKHFLTIVHET